MKSALSGRLAPSSKVRSLDITIGGVKDVPEEDLRPTIAGGS
jgi:hypothetical protein